MRGYQAKRRTQAVATAVLPPLFLLLFCAGPAVLRAGDGAPNSASKNIDDQFPRATLETTDGCKLSLVEARGEVATIIMCMSTECPISNEFLPAIKEVADKYRDKGVRMIGIDPNGAESLETMTEYAKGHKLSFPFAKDEGGKVSRGLLFSVTPEARVFDAAGKIVYQGRIDNRYRAGGGRPGAKITGELARALDELIAGERITQSRTRPVGCPIQIAPPGSP